MNDISMFVRIIIGVHLQKMTFIGDIYYYFTGGYYTNRKEIQWVLEGLHDCSVWVVVPMCMASKKCYEIT